jgi:hypothetical protein
VFVGDDNDQIVAFGDVVKHSNIECTQVVGNNNIVAFSLGENISGDGDAGCEFKEEVKQEENKFAGHKSQMNGL